MNISTSLYSVIFQRHGIYDKSIPEPGAINSDSGWLTVEGITQTDEAAKRAIEKLIAQYGGTWLDFTFFNSPAKYMGRFGARAEHTAKVSAGRVYSYYLNNNNVSKLLVSGKSRTQPVMELNELQISDELLAELEERFEGGFWELYYNMSPELNLILHQNQLETPIDITNRVKTFLRQVERLAYTHTLNYPGHRLVVWCTTHGDVLRTFIQYGLGAADATKNWRADYSQVLQLDSVRYGVMAGEFLGTKYQFNL